MERSATTPDEYLAGLEDAGVRADLEQLDRVITSAMPGRSRTLWEGVFWGGTQQSIIGYGDIVQTRSRGADVEWFLVGLARQKEAYSIYVNAVENGTYLGRQYESALGKVKLGSASIGFRRLDDVDLGALAELAAHADQITRPDARAS